MSCRRPGFSLVELVVVMAIVALLLTILLPALVTVRHMARSAVCLSHLQQIGDSFLMYLNANHGHAPQGRQDLTQLGWWEQLQPYNGSIQSVMLCPEAIEPGNVLGSAITAWGPDRTFWVAAPQWIMRSAYTGSYGINAWLQEPPGGDTAATSPYWRLHAIHLPAKQAAAIPVFADCIMSFGAPLDTDTVPINLINPLPFYSGVGPKPAGPHGMMAYFCLDRHRLAVNAAFLDGHAQRVPLADLWKLQWNSAFKPTDVQVPR
ncbi:MAG TPA: prepilin-type N-terminal cleavage/methylation domain-containing protein [Tepidisphaeraceae bacterium]|jgi:prepilin-type N-terminal cleavage/methylation domain-containing protein/prepilin-type processing-associated H-X9-DG protein|nr:prepilin-type N-terminal cleavage/methylation domain-containing protein [Tepidisphaeraceae bacterium]